METRTLVIALHSSWWVEVGSPKSKQQIQRVRGQREHTAGSGDRRFSASQRGWSLERGTGSEASSKGGGEGEAEAD